MPAVVVVADHSAEHPVVRCRNGVVLVEIERGERRCVDPENMALVDFRDHSRVEGMDAFHYENIFLFEVELIADPDLFPLFEIVFGNLDHLSCEKVIEVLVQQLEIHRLEALEIRLAVFVLRGEFPVDEVVVKFDDLRRKSEDLALLGESKRR